jgi:hypothetical protein
VAVQTKRSERFVRTVYGSIPAYIDGSVSDTHRIGAIFWSTLTQELFSRIHKSYVIRSEGGSDDLGNRFKPLKKSTIAQRPIGKGNLSEFGLTKKQSGTSFKNRTRGLLSPEEDREWKRKYSKVLSQLVMKVSGGKAEKIAAAVAWKHVKALGARTKLEVLGNRDVLIMRVTDRILNSLEPSNSGDRAYRPRKDQLYNQVGSKLEVGTLVEYAKYHNNTRPVIPDNIDPWVNQSVEIAMKKVLTHIKDNVL